MKKTIFSLLFLTMLSSALVFSNTYAKPCADEQWVTQVPSEWDLIQEIRTEIQRNPQQIKPIRDILTRLHPTDKDSQDELLNKITALRLSGLGIDDFPVGTFKDLKFLTVLNVANNPLTKKQTIEQFKEKHNLKNVLVQFEEESTLSPSLVSQSNPSKSVSRCTIQ